MKKKFFITLLITGVYQVKGIIDPLTCYTPLNALVQMAVTTATLQTLTMQPSIVNPAPSVSSTSSTPPTETPITPTTIGTNGQIITSGGYYQLPGCITYSGNNNTLTIMASNSTLDLNGQTISYSGSSSQSTNGIVISPGLSNITIRNGTIIGFPGVGILAQGTSNQTINHLTLDRIKVVSCYQGIIVCSNNNTVITNCITTGNMNPVGTTYGVMVINSTGVTLQNCTSQNNSSPTKSCYGYSFTTCKTTFLAQCASSGNEGAQESAGIYFDTMIKNNYIQNCACNGNSSTAADACGILIDSSNQTYVQDSSAQINLSEAPGFFGYGIRLRNSSNSFIKHNTIDGNDYGIYDDEQANYDTNIFTQNNAYQNNCIDYLRPNSSPLTFIQVQQDYLQGMLVAGKLDNISIRIHS